MIGKKVLSNEPIPNAEVRDILEEMNEKYELGYEQNVSLDHTVKFSKIKTEDAYKLIEELKEKKIRAKQAVHLVNLMPKDMSDLRLMFAKERVPITNEELVEVLEIINKYRTEPEIEIKTAEDETIEDEESSE